MPARPARGLAAAALATLATLAHGAPGVESFSPQGEAVPVRQVAARFSEPMVAFGDPRVPDPFEVRCEGDAARLKGQGRWVDSRHWVYDFAADLPSGQRCRFALKAGTKSVAGEAVAGPREFAFHTGGPVVTDSIPFDGDDTVDEEQAFLLAFDSPVDRASLAGAWCEAEGIGERIPVSVLAPREARALLEGNEDLAWRYARAVKGDKAGKRGRFKADAAHLDGLEVTAVRCARRLPAGAKLSLVLGEAVRTKTGIARARPQRLAFQVRRAFRLAFSCPRVNKEADCLPASTMTLDFSAPVPRALAAAVRLVAEGAAPRAPKLDPGEGSVGEVKFEGPFPEQASLKVELPAGFRDDAGRRPANASAFPMTVKTDRYPPLVKFPGRFGILETAYPTLPVTVRGVERTLAGRKLAVAGGTAPIPGRAARVEGDEATVLARYLAFMDRTELRPGRGRKGAQTGDESALDQGEPAQAIALPRPADGRELEVIGLPLRRPGFYIVEFESPTLGAALHGVPGKPYFVSTSVLVTNLAVHLKLGREGSLVWVTGLSDGKPVAGAEVSVRDCRGEERFRGRTDAFGVADAGASLPQPKGWPPCPVAAFARVGDDLSFTLSSWREGIEPWNFGMNTAYWQREALAIHAVFDRTLLRAGETVSLKAVARVPAAEGLRLADPGKLPRKVSVVHEGSDTRVALPVRFDAQGVATLQWKIPKEAKLGRYRLEWDYKGSLRGEASFRVEAFRVPLLKASLAAPAQPLVRPASARIDAAVAYLSGGPASSLAVKVRHRLEPRVASFADYPEFQFGGEAVREGTRTGPAPDWFDEESEEASAGGEAAATPVATKGYTLDKAGTAALVFDRLPRVDRPARLVVEMEYPDPNGERLSAATSVALHPAALYVGIRPESWAATKDGARAELVVVDLAGRPAAGRAVKLDVFERRTYSSRRRVLGGFYAYDSVTETKRIGTGCEGRTDARGRLPCEVKPGRGGELLLSARVADDAGREAFATASVWVAGDEDWWFDPSPSDRMDLVPEKRRYEPGETARFQARVPFREATALVTVEREGVLSHRLVSLEGRSPTIEVPIEGRYGPNVYVSALVVRGRLPAKGAPRPTGLVDLARPAYKLGTASIEVGRRAYELKVKVTPEREVYQVRDKARVAIEVTDPDGRPAAGGEVAVAAVDQGLLELQDNASWRILDGLLGHRPLEVLTATAQGHVVGRRHFGRKAVPAGGGGGRAGARELFDTLLLWKARVPLDAKGRAVVEIPLNDSLTAFRVAAVAQWGVARFGDGQASLRTTQDLMLLAGLPPVLREGDDFTAMFTLRNTTAATLATRFAWTVRGGAGAKDRAALGHGGQDIALAAGESRLVPVDFKVPAGVGSLEWEVSATGPGRARDAMRARQAVTEVHPVRAFQASLVRLSAPASFPVSAPAGALPGRGGVRVQVLPTLAGDLDGVRDWFRHYPYACIEQRTSKAIGLRDESLWRAAAASLPAYLDRDGLARYFPADWLPGSDALTAYLVQVADADGREWPEAALERMLGGLEAFATGRIVRAGALPTADLVLRKLAAIEALSRHGRANPAMLQSLEIDPPHWPTSALLDWIGILQRVQGVRDGPARLAEALNLLRSRLDLQGSVMTFSTERQDALWWLMASADANANRALLAVLEAPGWQEDVGRLVRGTLSRQVRGAWGTTVANAWGTVALARYAEAFEKTPPTGTARAAVGDAQATLAMTGAASVHEFSWPPSTVPLTLAHEGQGAPWALVQSRAAVPLAEPLAAGYRIRRTLAAVDQKTPGATTRGDVVRVRLEVEAQADMTWVVVDDPVPPGATILGSGLGGDSRLLAAGERREGWVQPAFVERTPTAYRAYYAFVPKGRFATEYTVRLNNAGRFELPATRVEAMYAPEMLGMLPNAPVTVAP